jgi:hypothetical protein
VSTVHLYPDKILRDDLAHGRVSELNRWRRMRRAAHEALTKKFIQNYHPIQIKEATIMVSSLLKPTASVKQDGQHPQSCPLFTTTRRSCQSIITPSKELRDLTIVSATLSPWGLI